MKLTEKQRRCLEVVAANQPMDHWDKRLDEFCDDGDPDTFNTLHRGGQLRTWNNGDDSIVMLTDVGAESLGVEGGM